MQVTALEYYQHLYPYDKLVQLLTCNGDNLANIEFALEGAAYKRYVSVGSAKELKAAVSNFPQIATFHFGAVYTGKPANNTRISVPVRRVLSFDIDLTDKAWIPLQDAAGNVSAELCDKAWPVSAASADILKRLLKAAFGYTRILVVYSGRRGVHVHVFDEAAMGLSDEARAAIVSYINGNLSKDGLRCATGVYQVMRMHGLHKIVYKWFNVCFVKQMHLFDNCAARVDFVNRLNLAEHASKTCALGALGELADEVIDAATGHEAWQCIQEKLHAAGAEQPWVLERLDCAVLAYVWPILDENVTRAMGHLTKVPFACHAKSGRVACAVNVDLPWKFAPGRRAPRLSSWDQDPMDDALVHFHARGVSDGKRDAVKVPQARDVSCDMEDLVAQAERACQVDRPIRSDRSGGLSPPRSSTWKRKKSPLVP